MSGEAVSPDQGQEQSFLIVEDSSAVVRILAKLIESMGFSWKAASTLAEAKELLSQHLPSVMLLDVTLPDGDGLDFLESFKQDDKGRLVPVLVLTSADDDETEIRAFRSGADDYLTKPFRDLDFQLRVEGMLRLSNLLRRLDAQRHSLGSLDRQKDALSDLIGHEFKTPLAKIKGLADNLKHGVSGEVTPEQNQVLADIAEHVDELTKMVNRIIDHARVAGGGLKMERRQHSFKALVQFWQASSYNKRSDRLELDIEHSEQSVWCDDTLFARVCGALVGNALKFSPADSPIMLSLGLAQASPVGEYEVHQEVTGLPKLGNKEYFFLRVSNEGEGVQEKDLPLLCEQFWQVDTSSTRRHGGTGMGLAFVKKVCQMHAGQLHFYSSPGNAFCVELLWPVDLRG